MDNQHRKIKGYRELSQDGIDLMNEVKEKGEELEKLITKLEAIHATTASHAINLLWLKDGEMQLKKGIMSLVRAIAQPESF